MRYGREIPGFCSECGQQTNTLPCPHCGRDAVFWSKAARDCVAALDAAVASVTEVPPIDQYLGRCRRCGQWKDMRVECIVCRPPGSCVECKHPVREHSSEPGVGCLHFNLLVEVPADPYDCPCTLPGMSQADQ